MICFSHTFTLLLRRKETVLTKSSLPCKSSLKFKTCKSLASNNEATLTYWPLKKPLKRITFYKRDSATFKLLNCLDRMFLMSYEKELNDKFWKNELKTSKPRLLLISPERVNVIAEVRMFFLILMSFQSFYIIPSC